MKANCRMGNGTVMWKRCPIRRSSIHATPSSKSPRPPSAAPICTSTTVTFRPWRTGDILGHEFMGEVVEVGRGVTNLKVGDRVVVPFPISCGNCWSCQQGLFSLCENSNPNAAMAEQHDGPFARRSLRLFPPAWRLCRWTGGVCAGALCRCRSDQNPRWLDRRAGAVSL